MTSSSKTNKTLLIGSIVTGAIAGGAILAYVLTRPPKKTVKVVREVETRIKDPKKELSKTDLCLVLQEITFGVQQTIMQLAQEENTIMKTPGAANLTPDQVQTYLLQRFQEGVTEVEHSVYIKNNVSEIQVQVASEAFENDEDVKRAVQQLKSVYGAVMGGNAGDLPEVPEFLTKEKTLEVLEKTMEILRTEAAKTVEILKEKGIEKKKDVKIFQVEFQKLYGGRVEQERQKLYSANGIEKDLIIQAAVVKYQNDLNFQKQLKLSSEEHNNKMAELGFFPPQQEKVKPRS